MKYTRLGKSELFVSKLGFGLMRLPVSKSEEDNKESIQLINYSRAKGINFFDIGTFYCFEKCETIFGEALKLQITNNLIYSGKNSTHQIKTSGWTEQLKSTLCKFDKEYLDIYFIHYLELEVWNNHFIKNDIISQIYKAKEQGLIRYLGFSSHDKPQNIKKIIDTDLFDAVMVTYNLIRTENEELIQFANNKGLGVLVMNPLAGGLLTNDYFKSSELKELFPNMSISDIALRYALSNPNIHCVISGMRSVEEIDMNCDATDSKLFDRNEFEEINAIVTNCKDKNYIYCTGCNYCMPCPQGIPISEILTIMNRNALFSCKKHYDREYSLVLSNAECCIQCGNCEKKCPNHIQIMELMKRAVNQFN